MYRFILLPFLASAKLLTLVLRLLKLGSGTTLPGWLIERHLKWLCKYLGQGYQRIIFISGTNGKTTTRAILAHIYQKHGYTVCNNRGGANILRGIASTLLQDRSLIGLPQSQILILEVEEATLPTLSKYIQPDTLILTNIFRDQLDAYGEIDTTLNYFRQTLRHNIPRVVVNAEDYKLLSVLERYSGRVTGFYTQLPDTHKPSYEHNSPISITYSDTFSAENPKYDPKGLTFSIRHQHNLHPTHTSLPGYYNINNILAAVAESQTHLGWSVLQAAESFQPVFGRGESVTLNQTDLSMFLVKNPAGFDQVLNYLAEKYLDQPFNLVILINDNTADGKDVSWLWDVNLEAYANQLNLKRIRTGGSRYLDILLRMEYAGYPVDLSQAKSDIQDLLQEIQTYDSPTVVLSTYTATLEFRKLLSKYTQIQSIYAPGN